MSANPREVANRQFDIAADVLGLDASLRNVLRHPKVVMQVAVPVRMDSGETASDITRRSRWTRWSRSPRG